MAAGLGTRMKQRDAEAPAPAARPADGRLGRRRRRAEPASSRSSSSRRRERRDLLEGVEVAVQEEPLGTGDAVRRARAALEGFARRRPRPQRRRPGAHARDAPRARRDAPPRGRRRDRPLLRAGRRRAPTGGSSATPTGQLARIVEAARRVARGARAARGQLRRSTSSAPRSSGRRSTGSSRTTLRASCTSPTRSACSSPTASRSPSHIAADPLEAEGVNTRAELALAAGALRDRINEAHMLAGVTIVDPASTWIEAGVEIEPDVDDPSCTSGRIRARRPDRSVASTPRSGRSPTSGRGDAWSARARRSARSSRSRTRPSEPARRSRTSRTSATPRWGRARTSRAGNITANFPHEPGEPKGRTTIGRNVRTGVDNVLRCSCRDWRRRLDCSRDGHHGGCPSRLARRFRPRDRTTKEGWVYEKHGKPDGD